MVRKAAVAGHWYPGAAPALAAAVDRCLARAHPDAPFDIVALIAPHAGLMYSGPIAAWAYKPLRGRDIEIAVLVGPSHFVAFDGVAIQPSGTFEMPFGAVAVDEACAADLMARCPLVHERAEAHAREHSLEMQLPFLQRVLPEARIVPLVMGAQTADTAQALGDALAESLAGRKAVIVASSDLSHYHDAATAAHLDGVVLESVARFDADGLQASLTARPDHACGGGPMVAVMRAARQLGARDAAVLQYGDSGDVSGDKTQVVGYLAAAFGTRTGV